MSDLDKQLMNADSFDELYLAYYPAMLSYARMFLRDQWAEDVVQDVFFNIWKNRHRISTDDPLYKYLLKAVYNRAINYIWKHKRDTEYRSWYGSQIDRMVFDYYDPDKNPILAKIYDNDIRQQLRQAVDELPDKRREIFRMRFFENMSNKEIGERLGLTVSTVENHMYAALKQLRRKLSKEQLLLLLALLFMR